MHISALRNPRDGGPGPDNITCEQYLLIQQYSAIHFANHLILPAVCDRERLLVSAEIQINHSKH